jgi:hypothetical protein
VVSRTAERVARVERAARRSVTPGSRARTALVGEAPLVGVVGEARGLRVEKWSWMVRWARTLRRFIFPSRIHARELPAFPVSRAKVPHGISYVSLLFSAPFLPLAPRLPAASSREIIHKQAGRCGARDCS